MLKAKRSRSPTFGSARPAIFAMISCAPSVKESRNSAPNGSTVVTVRLDRTPAHATPGGSTAMSSGRMPSIAFMPGVNAMLVARIERQRHSGGQRRSGCPAHRTRARAGIMFIAGLPMKPATNRLAGAA